MTKPLPAPADGVTHTPGAWTSTAYQAALTRDWRRPPVAASTAYPLFQEMEDKDSHLFAVLQTRKLAVLAGGWRLVAEGGAMAHPLAERALAICEEGLAGCSDFPAVLHHLLDALGKGWALAEVVWSRRTRDGLVMPERLLACWPEQFGVAMDGSLWQVGTSKHAYASYGAGTNGGPRLFPRPGETAEPMAGQRVPPRKVMAFAFQGGCGQPYGTPLCAKAYWYSFFRKHNLKFWGLFNERYGAPTAVVRYPSTSTSEEIARLQQVVSTLQTDSGVILPEGIALEFLEARQSSGVSTYRELADWCNDEISKIVLGQTLTTGEGRRSGSLALGQVHAEVRREYVSADARALAEVISNTLLRWMVDFNLGPDVPAPRFTLETEDQTDPRERLDVDERLIRLGVPLPLSWFHSRYRRPIPAEHERILRYDDANLYQYHLQFGVLTVNEVRATLGLPPVPWGNRPPENRGAGRAEGVGAGRGRGGGGRDLPEKEGEADAAGADEGYRDRRVK